MFHGQSYFSMAQVPRDLRQEIYPMSQDFLVVSESKEVQNQTNTTPQWWGYIKGYSSQLEEEVKKGVPAGTIEQDNEVVLACNPKYDINMSP